ncbi:uncharacterized protein E0L32_010774 [Thyridium curvatum]|uniref:D-lactate dehydrogenase (cytochrome) n=1 Tax=Thyridium curvatum TaxID=1093900 RepID=A0A507AK16_9PEZI|nr:uncharacterized protein E0L32_010774 [Thyridium curvatum]TPX07277.1 hypothetical protein E0L32_010774 [Thyridium curvatum]
MANPLRRIHCHGGRPCRRLASRGGPINSTFSHRASSSPLRAAEPSSPRWSSHSSVPGPQSVAAPQIGRSSTSPLALLGIGLGLLAGAVAGWAFSTSDRKQGSAKPQYATIAQMEQAITEVQRALGEDSVSTDSEILLAHGYSEWSTVNIDRLPVAVVFPSSTEEVSTVAKICHKYNIPIIPFSGGSSVEGNFSAPVGGFSVDFMNMNQIVKFRPEEKSSAGYNLNSLFVGSEGTLGLVTEATLKLAPAPTSTGVAVISFPTIKSAASMAVDVVRKGIVVGAIEILDDVQMKVINKIGATGRTWREEPTLFIKFTGDQDVVDHNIKLVQKVAREHGSPKMEFENDAEKQKVLWSARKEALWSMLALRTSGSEVWTTDVAVPLSRVAELIECSKKDLDNLNLFGSIIGHVGDGNFHETILFDGAKERQRVEQSVHRMVRRALDMEGTCTGEHGVGLGKIDSLQDELGDAPLSVMRAIKTSLDPKWLMNPGKIFHFQQ